MYQVTDADREKYAKIIEVDGMQVLYFMESDSEHDGAVVHQMLCPNGIFIDARLRGVSWERAEKFIESVDVGDARALINELGPTVEGI